jgi:hypothetical protein
MSWNLLKENGLLILHKDFKNVSDSFLQIFKDKYELISEEDFLQISIRKLYD